MSFRSVLVVSACLSVVACDSNEPAPAADSVAEVASSAPSAKPKPPPPTPDEVFRSSIATAGKDLPEIAKSRRFPYYLSKDDPAPKPNAKPDAPPPIVQVDANAVLVDGKKVDEIPKPEEPKEPKGAAAATNPNAKVTISHYGPPTKLPGLRKKLAETGAASAGLRVLADTPPDVLRGVLDALRREGYRDVYLQTSDDPSKVALVRVIWTSGREGIPKADEQEWFLTAQFNGGKIHIAWAESTKRASSQKRGKMLELAELDKGLCEVWKEGDQHVGADDPITDALVINTLFATPEHVKAVVKAADACKRDNGRPALWVAARQMVFD